MAKDYSYLYDLGLLSHRPLIEPNVTSRPSEHIMATRWTALMTDAKYSYGLTPLSMTHPVDNMFLVSILADMGNPITQRHASVCASFISWMGTNFGRELMTHIRNRSATWARELKVQPHEQGNVYLAEWTIANVRKIGHNRNYRMIEYILAERADYNDQWELKYQPELSAEDYETVDKLVMWLSTRDGRSFYSNCMAEIETHRTYHPII